MTTPLIVRDDHPSAEQAVAPLLRAIGEDPNREGHSRAHIAYLPAGRVSGLLKLPRLLDVLARRLQVQERLTDQVARAVQSAIEPRGVAVRLEAAHLCMTMRGVEKQESITMTSSFLGAFQRDMALRQELCSALGAAPTPAAGRPRESRLENVSVRSPASAELEPSPAPPVPPSRIGLFTGESTPVPRGKYPQRVGPRPRLRGR